MKNKNLICIGLQIIALIFSFINVNKYYNLLDFTNVLTYLIIFTSIEIVLFIKRPNKLDIVFYGLTFLLALFYIYASVTFFTNYLKYPADTNLEIFNVVLFITLQISFLIINIVNKFNNKTTNLISIFASLVVMFIYARSYWDSNLINHFKSANDYLYNNEYLYQNYFHFIIVYLIMLVNYKINFDNQ